MQRRGPAKRDIVPAKTCFVSKMLMMMRKGGTPNDLRPVFSDQMAFHSSRASTLYEEMIPAFSMF